MITRLDQTQFGDKKGNCWATCIAMLLGLNDPEVVPNFCVVWPKDGEWFWRASDFVSRHGYRLVETPMGSDALQFWVPRALNGVHWIASGPGPRGCDHAVIFKGDKLWHDPHPSRAGLIEVTSMGLLVPIVSEAS